MKEIAKVLFCVFCLIFGALGSDVNATNLISKDSGAIAYLSQESYEMLNQKWEDLSKEEVMKIAISVRLFDGKRVLTPSSHNRVNRQID